MALRRDTAYGDALELSLGAPAVALTMRAAVELRLPAILMDAGGRAMTAAEIVARFPPPGAKNAESAATKVNRMLALLACYEVVQCEVAGGGVRRYRAAPACRWFTDAAGCVDMSALTLLALHPVLIEAWFELAGAVTAGGVPFRRAHGMGPFEYIADERYNRAVNRGMKCHSFAITSKLLELYRGFDDGGISVLVDVGGGIGATLQMITAMYPHIKGVNFDLPVVIADAAPIPGVEHVAGDMFDGVPHGDAIIIKSTLHTLSDGDCVRVLRKCREALPEGGGGKVIVVEYVMPAAPERTARAQDAYRMDVDMLALFNPARERTLAELEGLAAVAGFSRSAAAYIFGNLWCIDLYK